MQLGLRTTSLEPCAPIHTLSRLPFLRPGHLQLECTSESPAGLRKGDRRPLPAPEFLIQEGWDRAPKVAFLSSRWCYAAGLRTTHTLGTTPVCSARKTEPRRPNFLVHGFPSADSILFVLGQSKCYQKPRKARGEAEYSGAFSSPISLLLKIIHHLRDCHWAFAACSSTHGPNPSPAMQVFLNIE